MADNYIQKLERRIHRQRERLAWFEKLFADNKGSHAAYHRPKWFEKVIAQAKELRDLRQQLKR